MVYRDSLNVNVNATEMCLDMNTINGNQLRKKQHYEY